MCFKVPRPRPRTGSAEGKNDEKNCFQNTQKTKSLLVLKFLFFFAANFGEKFRVFLRALFVDVPDIGLALCCNLKDYFAIIVFSALALAAPKGVKIH